MSASLALLGLVVALVGCSTDSGNTQSTTSATSSTSTSSTTTDAAMSQACASAATLKSSLQALTTLNPVQDGQAAVSSAITKVKTDLDAAVASASGALKPDVDQVKTAVDQLQAAASGLTADNFVQRAPAIAAATRQVGTAATALADTLQQSCPGM